MRDIAIYGAGGFGKEVACLIRRINDSHSEPVWNLIGFFDDGKEKGEKISHYGICLGGMEELNQYKSELCVTIAIGSPKIVKKVVDNINNPKIVFPNLIHPTAVFVDEQSFTIGKGNIIQGGCSFSCDVKIGDFNVFNGIVILGHDDIIGSFNSFMPDVKVSGEVTIGDCNFFGVASIILQQMKIGDGIRLGAGSVLMTKPKDGELYIGNPAKRMKF